MVTLCTPFPDRKARAGHARGIAANWWAICARHDWNDRARQTQLGRICARRRGWVEMGGAGWGAGWGGMQ